MMLLRYNSSFFFFFLLASQLLAQDNLEQFSYSELDSLFTAQIHARDLGQANTYAQFGVEKAKAEFGEQDSTYLVFLNHLSKVYFYSGDFATTETLMTQIKDLRADVFGKMHPDYAGSLNNLAVLYAQMSQLDKALPLYRESVKIKLQTVGNQDPGYAKSVFNLGSTLDRLSQFEEAEKCYLESLEIFEKTIGKQHLIYSQNMMNLGILNQRLKNYEQSTLFLDQAKDIIKNNYGTNHPEYANALSNITTNYINQGLYREALKMAEESTEITANTLGKQHLDYANRIALLSNIYFCLKKFDLAEKLILEAMDIGKKSIGTENFEYFAFLSHLAVIYQKSKAYNKAADTFLEAITIGEQIYGKRSLEYFSISNSYLNVLQDQGRYEELIRYSIENLSINANVQELSYPLTHQMIEQLKTIDYFSTNSAIKTLQTLVSTLNLKKPSIELFQQLHSYSKLALHLIKREKNEAADEKDQLIILKNNAEWTELSLEIITKMDSLDAMTTYEAEAFRLAEENKSVLLAQSIQADAAHSFGNLPDSLVQQEKELQSYLSELRAALLEPHPEEQIEAIRQEMNATNIEMNAFKKRIEVDFPKYSQLKFQETTSSAEALQATLDENTAILEYVFGRESIYGFYIDQQQIHCLPLPIEPSILKKNIHALHTALSDYKNLIKNSSKAYDNYATKAYWFYRELVEPLVRHGKDIDHLVIITDGELGHLPFESFLVSAAPNEQNYQQLHYLLRDYAISYDYSASLWNDNQSSSPHANNGQVLALAASYDHPIDSLTASNRLPVYNKIRNSLKPLPAARAEVDILSNYFVGFFGQDSSSTEALFKEKAADYAVIHLAMHGILNHKNPILSSLAFTENGDSSNNNFLQAFEISHLELNADLVVLSACETGFGKFEQGNGIASLARSFMYAGVPSMLVSLWQVNDASTAVIMERFYNNMSAGTDKARALQEAKLHYIAIAKDLAASPAFWSPFIQLGNSQAIHIKRNSNAWMYWIGFFVLIGLGFIILIRKLS